MPSIPEKRKKLMDYLTKVMNLLDPTGANAKFYHDKFDKMTDAQFDKYMREFFKNEKAQFYLEIVEYERDLSIDAIHETAKFANIPLYENVAVPHITGDPNNVIVTPEPVPVGYVHEKRMPQTLMKKSAGSVDISKRNPLTGQVVGEDKNARNSDMETYSLAALGATNALREFMGPRADDTKAKQEMYQDIQQNGYCSLEDLTNDPYNKTSLNTFNTYFLIQGICTNLVTDLGVIPGPKEHRRY